MAKQSRRQRGGNSAASLPRSPALGVADFFEVDEDGIVTLSTGYRAKVSPISPRLVQTVTSKYQDPPVPTFHNEEKGRDEPNPFDPGYRAELERLREQRGEAFVDLVVVMGVELVDGLPDDDVWLDKLRQLESLGLINLGEYDLDKLEDKEFLFKRLVAVTGPDIEAISRLSGVTPQLIEEAEDFSM